MQQDWIMGLAGGGLIGLGGVVYLLGNGRIMGASGIVGGLVDGSGRASLWERLAFLSGVLVVPLLLMTLFDTRVATHLTNDWAVVIVAGLMVGAGSRIANGCTSGHGVCGISRLSLRGIVATLLYLLSGGLTLLFLRNILGII